MKAEELMTGDLLKSKSEPHLILQYITWTTRHDLSIALNCSSIKDRSKYLPPFLENEVEPITLTDEILRLNVFKFDIIHQVYYQHFNGADVFVSLPKKDAMYPYVDISYTSLIHNPEDVTEVSHENIVHFPQRVYVHQFQQFLRLCGMNEFANTLIVEQL